jgi:hypothetical protein
MRGVGGVGLYNGFRFKLVEGCTHVEADEFPAWLLVEEDLDAFVKFFSSCRSSGGVLEWGKCWGDHGCKHCGHGGCGNPPEGCAASNRAYFAVGFEERDELCRCNGVHDGRWCVSCTKEQDSRRECLASWSGGGGEGVGLVAVACGSWRPAAWWFVERFDDGLVNLFRYGSVCRCGWW